MSINVQVNGAAISGIRRENHVFELIYKDSPTPRQFFWRPLIRSPCVSIPRSGVVALAFALASSACLALAGCGNSHPLAGESGAQIAGQAVSDLKSASAFTISGTVVASGLYLDMNLGYKTPSSCQGTVGVNGKGSFELVAINGTAWVKPDNAFWETYAGSKAREAIAILGGKYLKASGGDSYVAGLARLCTVGQLSSAFTTPGAVAKGQATTVNGQSAVPLTNTAGATLYVSDSSSPRILRLSSGGSSVNFKYGPATVSPPPEADTIDGSQYGF